MSTVTLTLSEVAVLYLMIVRSSDFAADLQPIEVSLLIFQFLLCNPVRRAAVDYQTRST
jgi:hypothetical protein